MCHGTSLHFFYFCIIMKELLVRTLSGAVLVTLIVFCILYSTWTCWALALFIVGMGTFELSRLMHIKGDGQMILGELVAIGSFLVVTANFAGFPTFFLLFLFPLLPFLWALFSTQHDFKTIATYNYGAVAWIGIPCVFMVWMRMNMDPKLLLLVFVLLWTNDTFAYLTGRLLGKHKLFERISPGKTIEGSLGGLLFTMAGIIILSRCVSWLPLIVAIGMGLVAVVFGTLGDLCESMVKRQAGVKDSGKLIPGHGGVLDRFDSVLFAIPYILIILVYYNV